MAGERQGAEPDGGLEASGVTVERLSERRLRVSAESGVAGDAQLLEQRVPESGVGLGPSIAGGDELLELADACLVGRGGG